MNKKKITRKIQRGLLMASVLAAAAVFILSMCAVDGNELLLILALVTSGGWLTINAYAAGWMYPAESEGENAR